MFTFHEPERGADILVCRFGRHSCRPSEHRTRMSGEPAAWKGCPWSLDIPREEIPTGFRPTAQGCEERATLGNHRPRSQPQRGLRLSPKNSPKSACSVARKLRVPKK